MSKFESWRSVDVSRLKLGLTSAKKKLGLTSAKKKLSKAAPYSPDEIFDIYVSQREENEYGWRELLREDVDIRVASSDSIWSTIVLKNDKGYPVGTFKTPEILVNHACRVIQQVVYIDQDRNLFLALVESDESKPVFTTVTSGRMSKFMEDR